MYESILKFGKIFALATALSTVSSTAIADDSGDILNSSLLWFVVIVGFAIRLYYVYREAIDEFIKNKLFTFHFFMTSLVIVVSLIIIGVMFKAASNHYWIVFVVFLMLPFVRLWISGDSMRHRLSLELHEISKKLIIGAAIAFAILNLVNLGSLRQDIGKKFISGYEIERRYGEDCEADGYVGTSSDRCLVEDLSKVSSYGQVILYLIEGGGVLLFIFIPLVTRLAGEKGLRKKMQEEREKAESMEQP